MDVVTIGPCTLYHGDCREILPTLGGFDAVVTSPPYAMQREATYGGVPESEYPDWTVEWVNAAGVALAENGSVFINIREHRNRDGMSDYVHRTRLAVRSAGWSEVDEIVWLKSNSAPTGPNQLPRRQWERVLWFARCSIPRCDALDRSHKPIGRANLASFHERCRGESVGANTQPEYPRHPNWFSCSVGGGKHEHPAQFPLPFAVWLVKISAADIACDPFMGSGTTGVACVRHGRRFIGIEKDATHFATACKRIREAVKADKDSLFPAFGGTA